MSQQTQLRSAPLAQSHSATLLHYAVGFTVALLLASSAVHAQATHNNMDRVSLSSGTVIPVILSKELSSNTSIRGDVFTASIDPSKAAYDNIMHGATISGIVRKVVAQTGTEPGTISIAFTSLQLANGRTYPISGSLASLDAKHLYITAEGFMETKDPTVNNHLIFAGIGEGSGALISVLPNGKYKIESIVFDDTEGSSIGLIVSSPSAVRDVDLKIGMSMGVFLADPVGFDQQQRESATPITQRTYVLNETKYYWYNGQSWAMDLSSGERYHVIGNTAITRTTTGKYYDFQGHPYYIEPDTGVRTQLD